MENTTNEATSNVSAKPISSFESFDRSFSESDSTEEVKNLSVEAWSQATTVLKGKDNSTSSSSDGDNTSLTLTPIDWGSGGNGNSDSNIQDKTNDGNDNKPLVSDPVQESPPQKKQEKTAQELEDERVRDSISEAFKKIKQKESVESKQESPKTEDIPKTQEEKSVTPVEESDKTKVKPVESDKPAERTVDQVERDNIKKSLRDLYLNPKEDPLEQANSIKEELAKHDRQTLEDIAQEEIDELANSVPKKEYEETEGPSLLEQAKYPVLTALVAYGGYRILKAGGKAVLQRVRGNEAAEGKATESKSSESVESKGNESRQEAKIETKDVANEETKTEQQRGRRTRRGGQREVVELTERVVSKTSGDGLFQQEKVSGSEAILGRDKASESLTRQEVDMLKQEINRLKSSKDPAEVKKGNNLERVAKILENSNSPKVQERAHKIIRERIEAESANRGIKGSVGKAVGIGIIASAALYYYISTLDHSQDSEENRRATVSDK